MTVWLPWPPSELTSVPDGLDIDVWDGHGETPPSVETVELFVQPYLTGEKAVAVMARMPALRIVQTQTAGVDHIAPYLPAGVTLCNARGVHDASTAELSVALALSSQRDLGAFVRLQDSGAWDQRMGSSLADRTVLILGYGSIGAAVERRLAGFEVEIIRVASRARPAEGVAAVADLPALLPRADVVIVLVPLTDATRRLVDAAFLGRMHDGALLVNVARGAVVDTDALLAELHSGRLRAALDVTDPEPLPADHPLWHAPGVLITPHVGGATDAMRPRMRRLVSEQLGRFAAGEPLANVVVGVGRTL